MVTKALWRLGERAAVDQALSRLIHRAALLRAGRGVYALPVMNRFGTRAPSTAKMIAGIRRIASDLISDAHTLLPANKSQERNGARRSPPRLQQALEQHGLPAAARAVGANVFIDCTPWLKVSGYIGPAVMLEFGARSTG